MYDPTRLPRSIFSAPIPRSVTIRVVWRSLDLLVAETVWAAFPLGPPLCLFFLFFVCFGFVFPYVYLSFPLSFLFPLTLYYHHYLIFLFFQLIFFFYFILFSSLHPLIFPNQPVIINFFISIIIFRVLSNHSGYQLSSSLASVPLSLFASLRHSF